jgi:hypothetical protein
VRERERERKKERERDRERKIESCPRKRNFVRISFDNFYKSVAHGRERMLAIKLFVRGHEGKIMSWSG